MDTDKLMWEIRFKMRPDYDPNDDLSIVERVTRIIAYDLKRLEWIEEASKWRLDGSNDWWLRKGDSPNEFILSCRYPNVRRMRALYEVIIDRLFIEDFNEPLPPEEQPTQESIDAVKCQLILKINELMQRAIASVFAAIDPLTEQSKINMYRTLLENISGLVERTVCAEKPQEIVELAELVKDLCKK